MIDMRELFQQDDPLTALRQKVTSYNILQKQEIYWELEAFRLDATTTIDNTLVPAIKSILGKVEEYPIEKYQTMFWQALTRTDPDNALRQVVITLRGEGVSKGLLLSQLEVLRKDIAGEPEEDAILKVMDSLVGWCSPYMRIA